MVFTPGTNTLLIFPTIGTGRHSPPSGHTPLTTILRYSNLYLPYSSTKKRLLPTVLNFPLYNYQRTKHLRIWAGIWSYLIYFSPFSHGCVSSRRGHSWPSILSKYDASRMLCGGRLINPPIWLLDGKHRRTWRLVILWGGSNLMLHEPTSGDLSYSSSNATTYLEEEHGTYLIAPLSATYFLDQQWIV
jgi:hypothetical protein